MAQLDRAPIGRLGLIEAWRFDAGVEALRRATEADGMFCYTFFKGVGHSKPPADGG